MKPGKENTSAILMYAIQTLRSHITTTLLIWFTSSSSRTAYIFSFYSSGCEFPPPLHQAITNSCLFSWICPLMTKVHIPAPTSTAGKTVWQPDHTPQQRDKQDVSLKNSTYVWPSYSNDCLVSEKWRRRRRKKKRYNLATGVVIWKRWVLCTVGMSAIFNLCFKKGAASLADVCLLFVFLKLFGRKYSKVIRRPVYTHTEPLLPEIISEKLCLPAS